jgi:hypothetical protein
MPSIPIGYAVASINNWRIFSSLSIKIPYVTFILPSIYALTDVSTQPLVAHLHINIPRIRTVVYPYCHMALVGNHEWKLLFHAKHEYHSTEGTGPNIYLEVHLTDSSSVTSVPEEIMPWSQKYS